MTSVEHFFLTNGVCRDGRRWLRCRRGKAPAVLLAECCDGNWLAWSAHILGVGMDLQVQVARLAVARAEKALETHHNKRLGSYRDARSRLADAVDWVSNPTDPNDAWMTVYAASAAIELAAGDDAMDAELARSAEDARRIMGAAMLARCAELGVGP